MSDHRCAEIQYRAQSGSGTIHSDLCWHGPLDDRQRKFLHDCLDEYLDNSGGSEGGFYVGKAVLLSDLSSTTLEREGLA